MSPRKNAQVAFASALAVLLLSAISAYVTIVRLRDSAHWVVHTYQVESALGELESSMSAVARARTSYALNGDENVVEAFQNAIPKVRQKLREIRALTVDNTKQAELCDRLDDTIEQRIRLSENSVALKKSAPNDSAGQSAISGETLNLSSQSAAIMLQMRQEEQSLVKIRTAESNSLYVLTVAILAATFTLALLLFFVHYRLLNAELRAREQAERAAREGEESLRHLTARLLQMQDEERRKFSRELHDSLGQYLAGVKMNLDMFYRGNSNPELLSSAIQLLDQSIAETRTISHLLHPPLLDEVGFSSAAKWYVDGFSERSGIQVKIDIPEDLSRLPRALGLGLFRVLQESLTNIHRHSKSSRAEVKLRMASRAVVLQVKDYGNGIPGELLQEFKIKGSNLGVGLTGMRERVRELSGQLDINSSPQGTQIEVSLPILENVEYPTPTSAANES
jgi:signal transduction histidine kinase